MAFFSLGSSSREPSLGDPGRPRGGWGGFFFVASAVMRVLLRAPALVMRLLRDNGELRRLNRDLRQAQRQAADPARQRIILAMAGLTAVQLGLLAVMARVVVGGRWNSNFLLRVVNLKQPNYGALFNHHLVGSLALAFLVISAAANYQYFSMFVKKTSRYQKLLKALRDNGVSEREGAQTPWYYTGHMVCLDLIGVTGEEIVKREALWNQADFEPTIDVVRIPGTNKYIFTPAPKKPSNSTMFYDRYREWTGLMQDPLKIYHWFLGEYVNRNEYKWKDAYKDFSIAFIGQSGSGKTEAMKMWLTAFFAMHPPTRMVICDLKMTGDWDVFGPLCESGRVVKSVEETLLAISYFDDLLAQRTRYMQEKGYKNIKAWGEAEGTEVPPILLVIDEFPQMNGPLKFDIQSRRDGTPANVLFKLLTKGRSFGLWVVLGSQFSGSDAIPSELNKNIKVHVTLRTGSEGESMQWINSPAAFRLGKGKRRPDGEEDGQEGYAYIDAEEEYVRFWYMDDWFIVHELLKYGSPPMEGFEHREARVPGIPIDIDKRLQLLRSDGRDIRHLSDFDKERLKNHEAAVETFKKSYLALTATPHVRLAEKKKPLGTLWQEGETVEEYFGRSRRALGSAQKPQLPPPPLAPSPPPSLPQRPPSPSSSPSSPSSSSPPPLSPGRPVPGQTPVQQSAHNHAPDPEPRLGNPAARGRTPETTAGQRQGGGQNGQTGQNGQGGQGGSKKEDSQKSPAGASAGGPTPTTEGSDLEFARLLEDRRKQRRDAIAKSRERSRERSKGGLRGISAPDGNQDGNQEGPKEGSKKGSKKGPKDGSKPMSKEDKKDGN